MSDHEAADARLEQALSIEFSNFDSDLFSEKVASRVSRMVYLRYLVLSAGWLIGLVTFILSYPLLGKILDPWLLRIGSSTHQTLLTHFALSVITLFLVLVFTLGPLLLSSRRSSF